MKLSPNLLTGIDRSYARNLDRELSEFSKPGPVVLDRETKHMLDSSKLKESLFT